jgi:hypothetical protein
MNSDQNNLWYRQFSEYESVRLCVVTYSTLRWVPMPYIATCVEHACWHHKARLSVKTASFFSNGGRFDWRARLRDVILVSHTTHPGHSSMMNESRQRWECTDVEAWWHDGGGTWYMWISELGEAAFPCLWCVEFAGSLFISLAPHTYSM